MELPLQLDWAPTQLETAVIRCAEALFLSQGYEQTSMDMLAKQCRYTKRTIYRYFTCKEDLYFAVLLQGNIHMKAVLFDCRQPFDSPNPLKQLAFRYRDFYFDHEPFFDLMSHIRAVRLKRDVSALPYYRRYEQFAIAFHLDVVKLFQGTAPPEGDNLPAHAFLPIFLIQGLFGLLTQTGDRFTDCFGLDRRAFTTEALEYLLRPGPEAIEQQQNQ